MMGKNAHLWCRRKRIILHGDTGNAIMRAEKNFSSVDFLMRQMDHWRQFIRLIHLRLRTYLISPFLIQFKLFSFFFSSRMSRVYLDRYVRFVRHVSFETQLSNKSPVTISLQTDECVQCQPEYVVKFRADCSSIQFLSAMLFSSMGRYICNILEKNNISNHWFDWVYFIYPWDHSYHSINRSFRTSHYGLAFLQWIFRLSDRWNRIRDTTELRYFAADTADAGVQKKMCYFFQCKRKPLWAQWRASPIELQFSHKRSTPYRSILVLATISRNWQSMGFYTVILNLMHWIHACEMWVHWNHNELKISFDRWIHTYRCNAWKEWFTVGYTAIVSRSWNGLNQKNFIFRFWFIDLVGFTLFIL